MLATGVSSDRSRAGPPEAHFDAVVIGRGPIGLAAALALSQGGARVACVGPEPGPARGPNSGPDLGPDPGSGSPVDDWDPRVYALSPASRQLLERLRVWNALEATRIAPVYDMRIFPRAAARDPDNVQNRPAASRPLLPELLPRHWTDQEVHFGAYEGHVEALAWIIEGRNLSQALARALSFSDVTWIDARLASLDPSPGSSSRLVLDDGRELTAALVVGADGARSPTRQLAGLAAKEQAYPQTAVVANFQCEWPHQDCAFQWFTPQGILALLPLPGERCSMVWSAPEDLAPRLLALSEEELAERVSRQSGRRLGVLRSLGPAQAFPLTRLLVPTCVGRRLVLLGDAAHVVHPLAGQGMNLGFGDVAALADVLAGREPWRDIGDPLLLRRFERARREAVVSMVWATEALQRLFDPGRLRALGPLSTPLGWARDLGWSVVARSGWLRRQLIAAAAG